MITIRLRHIDNEFLDGLGLSKEACDACRDAYRSSGVIYHEPDIDGKDIIKILVKSQAGFHLTSHTAFLSSDRSCAYVPHDEYLKLVKIAYIGGILNESECWEE